MVALHALSPFLTHFKVQPLLSKADSGKSSYSLSKVAALPELAQQQHGDEPSSTHKDREKDY